MVKGQWVKVIYMDGEPRMTGAIGQYEHTDDMGQIHGTWGCAIHPDTDRFEVISEEEGKALKAKRDEERKPKATTFGSANVPFKVRGYDCVVELKFTPETRCVCGVMDCDCRALYSVIESTCGVKGVGVAVNIRPCDLRKSYDECVGALKQAVLKAMEG